MKISKAKQKIEYTIETTYPAQYWEESRDLAICKLARKFKGSPSGSGLGMGGRDNGFWFKAEANRAKFIKALEKNKKTLKVNKVFLSVWLDD